MTEHPPHPHIFTFWEPKECIPGYIRLCMQTWKRFLPDYEINILDYSTLGEFLTEEEMNTFIDRRMSLQMQADCIRCILLEKWGGIWMDADTIIRKHTVFQRLISGDASLICNRTTGICFGAFFYAARPHTEFFTHWLTKLKPRLQTAYRFHRNVWLRLFFRKKWRRIRNWNFCENDIIDPLAVEMKEPALCVVGEDEIDPMLERIGTNRVLTPSKHIENYRRFWFEHNEIPAHALEHNNGLIFLHNSWTPEHIRKMSEDDFLATDCTMARLLKEILSSNSSKNFQ